MNIGPVNNNFNTPKNLSFGNVKISEKNYAVRNMRDPDSLKGYIKQSDKLENMKIDLKEMVKDWKLTPSMKYVLKNFFKTIGEDQTKDFTVRFDDYYVCDKHKGHLNFVRPRDNAKDIHRILVEEKPLYSLAHIGEDKPEIVHGKIKKYGYYKLPSEKLVLSTVNKVLKYDVEQMASVIDKQLEQQKENEQLEKIRTEYFNKTNPQIQKRNSYYADPFPKSSLSCRFDEIMNYVDEHRSKYQKNIPFEAFNEPVTEDGETLLIALTHVVPDENNAEKYAAFVEELTRYPSGVINFNQKDSMGVPFIDHVLNSKNKCMLLMASNIPDLKYEPELENTFDSIDDPEFKDMVLKLDIFNNTYNLKYKTIFHQPNPSF